MCENIVAIVDIWDIGYCGYCYYSQAAKLPDTRKMFKVPYLVGVHPFRELVLEINTKQSP